MGNSNASAKNVTAEPTVGQAEPKVVQGEGEPGAAAPAKPAPVSDSDYQLSVKAEPQFSSHTFKKQVKDFNGLLTIAAPLYEAENRPGIDVVCVIDVSGSMHGQKISLVRKAMRRLVRSLNKRDRVCFVTFDSNVNVLMPFKLMDDAGKDQARNLVKSLQDGSATDLCGGLTKGMEILKSDHVNEVTSILLFTDGQANEGIRDADGILREALRVAGVSDDPLKWTTHDVQTWLQKTDLALYCAAFQENGVDGHMLVTDMSDEILQNDLNVKKLHLSKFNRELQKLRKQTGGAEGEKDHFAMQVNTFGFGSNHNTDLLEKIASQFDGMYYYMENEKSIVAGFANCLGGMLSTVAQDIEATFMPCTGVTDFLVRKDDANIRPDGSVTVKFGDVQSEEKRHVLVSATLPALDSADATFSMFKATVTYRNLVRECDETVVLECLVNRNGTIGAVNEDVDVSRNRILATDAMSLAEEHGDKDDLVKARKVITDARDVILSSDSSKNKFCSGLVSDLNNCLEGLRDRHQYRNVTKNYMTQNIMCHKVERACNFDDGFASQMTYNNESRAVTFETWQRADSLDSCEDMEEDYQNISSYAPQNAQLNTFPGLSNSNYASLPQLQQQSNYMPQLQQNNNYGLYQQAPQGDLIPMGNAVSPDDLLNLSDFDPNEQLTDDESD